MIQFQFVDFLGLLPLVIVLVGILCVLLLEAFSTEYSRRFSSILTLLTFIAAWFSEVFAPASEHPLLTPWVRFDQLSHFFTELFLLIGVGTTLLTMDFFQRFKVPTQGEYFFLQMSAIFGLILIGVAADFLTLFLGIETLSISLYVLCVYMKNWEISAEGALKYFLMGSLGAAILLYGIALIYGATGTTSLSAINGEGILLMSGVALVASGLALEAALVPYHLWAPDVYDAAPTPVTALMAVGTKVGAFAALIRVFVSAFGQYNFWREGLSFLIYPTLIYANLVAMRQQQMRRFFAYSGISHAGFLLIPIVSGGEDAISSMMFYLIVYALATLGCFAVFSILDDKQEGVMLSDLTGLFWRSPFLASVLSLCLLTLAGIPPTVGFFAKLYIFKVAFEAGYYGLVVVGSLMTIFSAYYYIRIIAVMLSQEGSNASEVRCGVPATIVGTVSAMGIIFISLFPDIPALS